MKDEDVTGEAIWRAVRFLFFLGTGFGVIFYIVAISAGDSPVWGMVFAPIFSLLLIINPFTLFPTYLFFAWRVESENKRRPHPPGQ